MQWILNAWVQLGEEFLNLGKRDAAATTLGRDDFNHSFSQPQSPKHNSYSANKYGEKHFTANTKLWNA